MGKPRKAINKDKLIELINNGYSVKEIAKKLNRRLPTIIRYIHLYDVDKSILDKYYKKLEEYYNIFDYILIDKMSDFLCISKDIIKDIISKNNIKHIVSYNLIFIQFEECKKIKEIYFKEYYNVNKV